MRPAIKKLSLALFALPLLACTLPANAAATHLPSNRCGNSYMKAMTHTDFEGMYACMGGDLRHRLEERADARNETPADLLGWDQGWLELSTTGDYQLLKEARAPVGYQLWDEQKALLYHFGTVSGPMGMILLLDHRGYVGGTIGPFYASG